MEKQPCMVATATNNSEDQFKNTLQKCLQPAELLKASKQKSDTNTNVLHNLQVLKESQLLVPNFDFEEITQEYLTNIGSMYIIPLSAQSPDQNLHDSKAKYEYNYVKHKKDSAEDFILLDRKKSSGQSGDFEDLKDDFDELKQGEQPKVSILNKFIVYDQYMDKLTDSQWRALFDKGEKDLKKSSSLATQIKGSVTVGLQNENRLHAWCVMLDLTPSELDSYSELYQSCLGLANDLTKSTQKDVTCQRQIRLDIPRTFSELKIPELSQPIEEGNNPLYNVLVAYSKIDSEVGYTQGMNFLAAMILIGVKFEESIAFAIFDKVMRDPGDWGQLYLNSMPKLFDLTEELRNWFRQEHFDLWSNVFEKHGVLFEAIFASPFLAMFGNLIELQDAMWVLDRLIFGGQSTLLDIIKNVFASKKHQLIAEPNVDEIYLMLTRKIYQQAIQEGCFFPLQL